MDVQRWLVRQEVHWASLEKLLHQAEKNGIKTLSARDIRQLSSLYRLASADLARAQTRQLGIGVTDYLQDLVRRGYSQVYQGRQRQDGQEIIRFYQQGFPQTVQASWTYILAAVVIFGLGIYMGWYYTWQDPAFKQLVIPEHILRLVQEEGKLWMGSIVGVEPLASSQIMTNNISVTLSALAGGIFAGLGTIFILWYNGLHIGAIATLVGQHNLAYPFWAFVFPHGALELPAIFLSGAAGLRLGQALIFPGRRSRLLALKQQGQLAAQLMFGVVPMLIIAGLVEGFFSPNPAIPDGLKYLVGIILLVALMLYCFWPLPQSNSTPGP